MPILGVTGNYVKLALSPFETLEDLSRYGKLAVVVRGMNRGFIRPKADGSKALLFAYGPELLGTCFNTKSDIFHVLHVPRPESHAFARISTGLAMLRGQKHKSHRGLVKPALHPTRFLAYRDSIVEFTEGVMQRWKMGDIIDLVAECQDILRLFHGRILLGLEASEGVVGLLDLLQDVYMRRVSAAVTLSPDLPLSPKRRALALAEKLSAQFDELLRTRRPNAKGRTDLLSLLIEARDEEGQGLSDDEIVGHVASAAFASYDTLVHSMAVAVYLLAQFPHVARRLHDELRVLGGTPPRVQDFDQLPYLDAVVKETLRLAPAAPFVLRTNDEATELGGYALPPATEILLSIYHTHRMPELFPEPRRFLPERWSSIKPGPYEYLPFSVGPHMCTGWALALLEMKVMLGMFVQRFRFEVPHGVRLDRRLLPTVGLSRGLPLRLHSGSGPYPATAPRVPGTLAGMFDRTQG